jgi:hypothetical protein
MENQLSPEGQRDYEAFLRRIPGYFQNDDFMNEINTLIVNDGTQHIDHEKLKARGVAVVRALNATTENSGVADADHQ